MASTNVRGAQIKDADVSLTVDVIGTLPIANGGTSTASLPTGLLVGAGTGSITAVTAPSGAVVGTTDTQTQTNKTLSDTFIGDSYDTQKTQQNVTLLASNDFLSLDIIEIDSTDTLEIPSTSTLEILTYPGRRGVGRSVAATAVTINTDVYERYMLSSLAAGITVTLSGMGGRILVGFEDNGTSRAITWANAQSSGLATLLAATVINKTHWVGLIHDGATWTCLAVDATGY